MERGQALEGLQAEVEAATDLIQLRGPPAELRRLLPQGFGVAFFPGFTKLHLESLYCSGGTG